MKRPLRPDELKLWSLVAATVRPGLGRIRPMPEAGTVQPPSAADDRAAPPAGRPAAARKQGPAMEPSAIEPRRHRRLARGRDALEARIDLHGLDQDRARAALHGFLLRAQAEGVRAVLVITGKGVLGDGVLRRRAPEWLNDPQVRHLVAGVSEAAAHHGGAGALYVALKRRG